MRLAKLDGADLTDANLSGAEELSQSQLDRVRRSGGAKLPEGVMRAEDAKR